MKPYSMTPQSDPRTDIDARTIAESLCPDPVSGIHRVPGGGNNFLYRVEAGARRYALKIYLAPTNDERDRLSHEYAAYRFLSENGITDIPAPIASEPARRAALYTWIDGAAPGVPGSDDVAYAAAFLTRLHALGAAPGAGSLDLAAEASLSGAALEAQVVSRRAHLSALTPVPDALADFLAQDFDPALARVTARAKQLYTAHGWEWNRDIGAGQRTPSPSDFGFHNALRTASGGLVFLDFEYFGWDDPVRAVADFVLHPGHEPAAADKRRFVDTMSAVYAKTDPDFPVRLAALYPLVALRWAMIALGVFLPHRMARRMALESGADSTQILARQLEKARTFVADLNIHDGAWPYGD